MTTHTPTLGRLVPAESLRFISAPSSDERTVLPVGNETFEAVAQALGVLPDHRVKIFVGVEGKHDISFLTTLSKILAESDERIDDLGRLEESGQLIFVPAGGSNVALWVSRLRHLRIPEFHIFDRDTKPPANPKYKEAADLHNGLDGVEAVHTNRREMENYLHIEALRAARPELHLDEIDHWSSVPEACARAIHEAADTDEDWDSLPRDKRKSKANGSKSWLNTDAVRHMTAALLAESDPEGDLLRWIRRISDLARE